MDANEAGSVPSDVGAQLPPNAETSSRKGLAIFKLIFAHKAIAIIAVVLLVIVAIAGYAGQKLYQSNKAASPVASRFDDQKIPLGSAVGTGALQLNTSQALSINGQLRANNTLVLSPSTQPNKGTAGQLYYDSTASRLLYHNGQSFMTVADTTEVEQLQTQLQGTASQEEVASIAQQLQQIQSELGQIQVPDNIAQLDGVNNFSAHNTFAAGLTAANLSVSGVTALGSTTASSLILSNPLGVASGGTGLNSLPQNGVLIGQGTDPVAVATASGAGQCLVSTAGAPTFQPCPGGGGGVNSLNGLSGALTLSNASTSGSTIIINDATTSSKGIASFNAANFTVSGGAVNTIQNISTTAAPLFSGLTVTNNLTAGTLSGDGTNVTNVNASQLGGQVATFYLNASNISSGTLNDARLSANVAQYNAPTANFTGSLQQGGNDVCTTAGNCIGSSAVGGSGTAGTIAVWDGSGFTLTDSLLSQSGGAISAAGDLSVSGDVTATNLQGNGAGVMNVNAAQLNGQTAAYYLNATNISAGTLSDARLSSNVTLQGNVFNGAGQLVQLNVDSELPAVSGALLTGLNASSISSGMLSDARLSANVALLDAAVNFTGGSLQLNGSDVCTTAGNCAGLGGGVTTSGGTPGTIAVFDGTGFSIADSLVSQLGTTVTINGDLVATNLAGNGTAVTNVNAAQLNGQGSAYYLNASNINSGTLSDTRLSANVTLQGNTFNGANQLVQLDATGALPALDGSNLLNVNAALLGGQNGAYYLDLANATGTLSDARLSSNVALFDTSTANFTGTLQQGGNDVCTTAGNCIGSGAVGGSGTAGTIAVWDGSGFTLTDSLLSQSGGTISAAGDLSVSGDVTATNLQGNGAGVTNVNAAQLNGQTAAYYLNATNISAGTLSDARLSSNVTLQGNVFNGAGQLVQLNASSQLPAVSGALLTGLNANNISSGTLSDARLSSNVALLNSAVNFIGASLQYNGSDVCTTAGNCAGVGGGVTTPGGTAGTLAVFDGAGFSIIDSLVSQAGGTVTISGDLVASTLAGDGTAITNVNAAQLNGQGAAYYLNASNINAGTLADARLSANVTLQGNTFNGANQLVQLDATGALPTLDGSNLTNVNAALLGGQNGAYYLDLTNATGTLNDARLSGNVALFDTATANFTGTLQQGGNNVCTTAGNCVGSGAVGGSGTAGTIAVWDGSGFTLTDSLLSESAGVVTVTGDLVADNLQGNGAGVTNVNAVQLNGQTAAYYLNASNVSAGTLADARLSANVTLQGNVFNGAGQLVQLNASSQLPAVSGALLTDLDADQISAGTLSDARLTSNVALYNAATANFTGTLQQSGFNVCTTAGNCTGTGGGVTTPGGTAGQLAVFSGAQSLVDSIISDNGSTVTIGGTLAVNTITPNSAMTVGSTSQALTLQGNGSTQLTVTSGGTTNSLAFATPSGTNKSVVIPNASGTVVVSSSGPLSIDANGNISCATCTTSGGGGGGAVDSLNGLNGSLTLANASGSGSTITIDDASTTAKGIASFNSSNFTVSAGAVNTVQNISVTSTPSFAGLTLNGNLSIGTNSIVTNGATINSTELDVLDNGIDESEVTGTITDVTAGNGLAGGASSGNATLNIASANGGITVNADNIALTLQPAGDGMSSTTSSGSGLEILSGGLALLQGCSDSQTLKWNETTDVWMCANDIDTDTDTDTGDEVSVNGTGAAGANFINTIASGTSAGVTWSLNNTPSPDEISIVISSASATQAGSVTTGIQTFAGDKTFNNAVTIAGLFTANGNITLETGDTITVNGDAISDFTGTGLTVAGGALQSTLGTTIDSSEIVDGTIVGADIAASTITNSNLVNSSLTVTAGSGLVNGGAVSLGGTTTLNIASANGGIAVNADNIALTLQPTGDGLSTTNSSGSGLEILSGGLALLQGCSDSQTLKWNEATDVWMCANDVDTDTDTDTGDEVSVNGTGTAGANFINSIASGTSAGVTWNLNNTPSPDEISIVISNASATQAGTITTGIQTFAGDKTFNGQIIASGGINLGTQTLQGTTSVIDFTNFDVLGNGNTTIGGTLTVNQLATFNENVTVAASKSLTITGGATGTRPASPTEGMLYFDTTTKQLLTYSNGKWQADGKDALIVAASNSSQADKDAANYVTDGNSAAAADGDQVQINAALTAASGKKVILLAGTYVADDTILVPNNTTLTGIGNGTVIELADLDVDENLIEASGTNRTGQVIQNIRLNGRKDLNTAGLQYGIWTSSVGDLAASRRGVTISDVLVENFNSNGITISGDLGVITRSTVIGATLRGISVNGNAHKITSNTVKGTNGSITVPGFDIGGDDQLVSGNISDSNGIGFSTSADNTSFINNTSKSNARNGFETTGTSENITFSSNNAWGNTLSGFSIAVAATGHTVTGNSANGNGANGISVSTSTGNTLVSGNNVSSNGSAGIAISSSNSNTISSNNIFNNGGATNNNGISLSSSDSNTISDNTISDSSATTNNYAITITSSTSDMNYLSGNILGTGSINDLGTGTMYGGQVNNSGNFMIQPAGSVELMKNTNVTGTLNVSSNGDFNGSLTVGSADQFVVSSVGVVTSGTWQGGTIGLAYGGTNNTTYTTNGIVYSNGTALVSTAAGSTGQCLLATTGSAPTWGTCATTNLQGTYNASSPATIDLSNSKDFTINATDQATDSSIVFNLQCVTCSTDGGRFAIQDAGVDIFRINPNGDIILGSASNNMTLTASNGYKPVFSGNARNSKVIRLHAEYPSVVLTADGSNNTGTLTSGYDNTSSARMNYYKWTTTQGSNQDYDIVVQVPLPSDFDGWDTSNPLAVTTYTSNTSNGTIALEVRDSSDAQICNFVSVTPGASGTWATNNTACTLSTGTYTAGNYITLRLRLQAPNGGDTRVGNITLNYKSKF